MITKEGTLDAGQPETRLYHGQSTSKVLTAAIHNKWICCIMDKSQHCRQHFQLTDLRTAVHLQICWYYYYHYCDFMATIQDNLR